MRATDVTAVTAVAARTLATCGIDKTRCPALTTLDNRYSRYILTRPDSPGPSGTREPLQPRTLSEHQRKLLTLSVERAVLAGPTAPRGHPPGAAPYEPWLRRVVAAIEEASSPFPAKEKAGGGWGGRKIAYKKGKGMCYHLP